jgi:hypothetical protein
VIALSEFTGACHGYVSTTSPRYTATAVLMLDTRRLQPFQQQSVLSDVSFDAVAKSQLELLRSKAIAVLVVNNLELLKDAKFTGNVMSFFGSFMLLPEICSALTMTRDLIPIVRTRSWSGPSNGLFRQSDNHQGRAKLRHWHWLQLPRSDESRLYRQRSR